MMRIASILGLILTFSLSAGADPVEIYCTIRTPSTALNCQWIGKERKVMNPEDIANFVDAGAISAFITLKSRKGIDRTYLVDSKASEYKRLADIKRSSAISEIGKAKSDLFEAIEKKVIKLSDQLDAQAAAAELVLYDSGITFEKAKREQREMAAELEAYRKGGGGKNCAPNQAYEQVSKTNAYLTNTLSTVLYAFQGADTCMAGFKVPKDADGSVDLRTLDPVVDYFKANCKKK